MSCPREDCYTRIHFTIHRVGGNHIDKLRKGMKKKESLTFPLPIVRHFFLNLVLGVEGATRRSHRNQRLSGSLTKLHAGLGRIQRCYHGI
jgi:hypothetical protein